MATPYVSGVVALMLSAHPGRTYDEIKAVLFGSSERNSLSGTGSTCGGTSDSTFPHNQHSNLSPKRDASTNARANRETLSS